MEIWAFFSKYDINGSLAVNDLDKMQVMISPNPTKTKINLSLNLSQDLNYELYSAIGQQLLNGTIKTNSQEIDLSNLPANIYYLKLGDQVFKVLKSN